MAKKPVFKRELIGVKLEVFVAESWKGVGVSFNNKQEAALYRERTFPNVTKFRITNVRGVANLDIDPDFYNKSLNATKKKEAGKTDARK